MNKNKEIKVKFKTVITLIIALFVIITLTVLFLLMSNKNNKNNKSIIENSNNTTINSSSNKEKKIIESDFSMKFLQMENNKKNMIYSPLSVKYALKMLNEGANGNTKAEIERIIGELNLTKYNNIDKTLSLANGLYIKDTYSREIKEEFKNILSEKYNAEINYDSFNNAKNINNWIEKKTLGIIKNMLNDELVQNPDSRIFLINALAIDMKWEEPFNFKDTSGEEFYLENNNKMIATMMNKETKRDNVAYYKEKDVIALSMDLKKYNDTQLEFVAIMPEENLSEYIETFTIKEFNNMIKEFTKASETKNGIDISMPKFSYDYDLKLKDDLINLGITEAFDKNIADFSNISSERLYLNDALHKANIDFTEEGVKAAAVTVMAIMDTALITDTNKPVEIKINKPFIYLIRDKGTGEIWFVGTVYEPNSWEKDKAEYR